MDKDVFEMAELLDSKVESLDLMLVALLNMVDPDPPLQRETLLLARELPELCWDLFERRRHGLCRIWRSRRL